MYVLHSHMVGESCEQFFQVREHRGMFLGEHATRSPRCCYCIDQTKFLPLLTGTFAGFAPPPREILVCFKKQ